MKGKLRSLFKQSFNGIAYKIVKWLREFKEKDDLGHHGM